MKKLLSIIIATIVALTFVACGGNDNSSNDKYADSEYLGTWVLVGYQVDDRTIEIEEHGSTELTLNADGTFVDISEAAVEDEESGEEEYQQVTTKGTWEETENGFTTTDDIFTLEYKVKGDKAMADYESTTLVRERK